MNNIYFSLGFFEALDSKGILNSLKKKPWNALTLQLSLSLRDKFISPKAMVINLFAILQVFLVGFGNLSGSFGRFIQASSEI